MKHNIKNKYTAPYTPQQNGVAERKWRTMFNVARCMLHDAKLPRNIWPYAIATNSYVRNRCFCQSTGRTRYELFTGNKPSISNMVPSGTKFSIYTKGLKAKLDDISHRGIFVGY